MGNIIYHASLRQEVFFTLSFTKIEDTKFLLLHLNKTSETIGTFFQAVYELYVKNIMSPFYTADTVITSKEFDKRVQDIVKPMFISDTKY